MMKQKLLSIIVSLMMVLNLIAPVISYADEDNSTQVPIGHIILDVEKATLGLGYVQEPIKVPFYEGQNGAQILISVLGEENIKYTGNGVSSFYLSKIKDNDDTELDGFATGRRQEGWLGEFDYSNMSGWMFCVNGVFPNVGMNGYTPKDNDVMRVQFTANGYGSDLGSSMSGSAGFKPANKDALIIAVANINSGDKSVLGYSGVRNAYKKANTVITTVKATQEEVDSALNNLNSALNNISSDQVAKPIASITLDKASAELFRGEKLQLNATVAPSDTTDYDKDVVWKTSNSEIAKVDQNGLITAKNAGECKIYAYAGDKRAVFSLTVKKDTSKIFEIEGGVLVRYNGEDTDITIPEGVTSIGEEVFKNTNIASITIPETVTSIGDYAFYNCTALKTINIPSNVKIIGSYALYNCSKLPTLDIPNAVTSIGAYAFYGLRLITDVTIPEGVTSISERVLAGCSALTNVTISSNLTEIGEYAFYSSPKLSSIKIAGKTYEENEKIFDLSNVTSIGSNAFNGCNLFEKINLSKNLIAIKDRTFYNCKGLASIEIPEGVASIGSAAFYNCTAIENISLPDTVETIDTQAFYGMTKLTQLKLSASLKSIASSAFANASLMTSITIPKSVESIDSSMVSGCSKLAEILVEDGNKTYKSIDGVLYNNLGELVIYPEGKVSETLEIPGGTTKLTKTLNNKKSLTKVSIPASVNEIDKNVFEGCTSLTTIEVALENESFKSVDGVLYTKSNDTLLIYPAGKQGAEYTVLDGCTSLQDNSFKGNTAITTLNMPASLEVINSSAISYANNLITVNMNASATKIADNAFKSCSKLTKITFPDTIESIGEYAFNGTKITEINIPKTVKSIGRNAFAGCSSATGEVVIPEGITEINPYVFSGCSKLTSIKVPEGVTSIGDSAFYNCKKLQKINIPEGVKTIGASVFSGCSLLDEVRVYTIDAEIGVRTFYKNSSDLTIYGHKDSTMEAYAKENSLKFVAFTDLATVKFVAEEQIVFEQEMMKGDSLGTAPQAIAKEGYEFVGWFKNTDDVTTKFVEGSEIQENTTYTAKYAHVEMLGAQAKNVVKSKSGIRFGTKIYNDGDEIVEKGTIILPKNLLVEGTSLTLDTPKAVVSIGKVNYEINERENSVVYLGSLVNIPENQFDREMTATAYVIYKDKAGNEYKVYSAYKNESVTINQLLAQAN